MKKTVYQKVCELKTFTFIVAIATLIVGLSACERVSEIIQPPQKIRVTKFLSELFCL